MSVGYTNVSISADNLLSFYSASTVLQTQLRTKRQWPASSLESASFFWTILSLVQYQSDATLSMFKQVWPFAARPGT